MRNLANVVDIQGNLKKSGEVELELQGYSVNGDPPKDREAYANAIYRAFRDDHELSLNGVLLHVDDNRLHTRSLWHVLAPEDHRCQVIEYEPE